jgi:hypothetical protein
MSLAAAEHSFELGKHHVQINGGPLAARGPSRPARPAVGGGEDWLGATGRALAPPPDVAPEDAEKLFTRGLPSRFRRRRAH